MSAVRHNYQQTIHSISLASCSLLSQDYTTYVLINALNILKAVTQRAAGDGIKDLSIKDSLIFHLDVVSGALGWRSSVRPGTGAWTDVNVGALRIDRMQGGLGFDKFEVVDLLVEHFGESRDA
ncbi:hypothetical protein N431DRAFT_45511 [Stipitochalara longipes BDJ]|nr:hypothetical protein N431DRAFT_45511 [Stipitochalara longipes BDJ]